MSLDQPVVGDPAEAAEQRQAGHLHRRQAQRTCQSQLDVAQHGEGHMQTGHHLPLIVLVLGAQAEQPALLIREGGGEVAKGAGLHRAAPGARDCVPVGHEGRLVGSAGARKAKTATRPGSAPRSTVPPSVEGSASRGTGLPVRWSAAPSSTGAGRPSGRIV